MVTVLTLPLEIRFQIYELVLTTPFTLRLKSQLAKPSKRKIPTLPDFQPTALLQICRQVHDEASTIFYQSNTFNFEGSGERVVFDDSLKGVAGLDMMRNISLRIPRGPLFGIIRVLEQHPSARALTVHYTSTYGFPYSKTSNQNAVPGIQERLDQFTVVTLAKISGVAEFGERLAVGYESSFKLVSEWPQISLASDFRMCCSDKIEEVSSRMGHDYDPLGICVATWRRKRER